MIDAPSVGVTDGASRVVWGRRITLSEREVHGKGTSELFASEQLLLERSSLFLRPSALLSFDPREAPRSIVGQIVHTALTVSVPYFVAALASPVRVCGYRRPTKGVARTAFRATLFGKTPKR